MQKSMLRFILKDYPSLARFASKHLGIEQISDNTKELVMKNKFQDLEGIEVTQYCAIHTFK